MWKYIKAGFIETDDFEADSIYCSLLFLLSVIPLYHFSVNSSSITAAFSTIARGT